MNPELPAQVVALISEHIYSQGTRWSYKLGDETPLDRLKALSSCCQSLRKSIVPFIFKKARLVIRSKQPIEELNSVSKSLLPSVTHLKVTDHGCTSSPSARELRR